jgi:hypothetical protein
MEEDSESLNLLFVNLSNPLSTPVKHIQEYKGNCSVALMKNGVSVRFDEE